MRAMPGLFAVAVCLTVLAALPTVLQGMGIMSGRNHEAANEETYEERRREMVKNQLAARDITDPEVLDAFRKVRRHLFVPEAYRDLAYTDQPLPIGHDQTISQPYIVAYMTQALKLEHAERVLEVGTGSGYQAAILSELCSSTDACGSVYTIEIIEELGEAARRRLSMLGYDNVHVRIGDGYEGWPEYAPYDAIIVTAAPTHVPEPLKNQLEEGGRMIIPVGRQYAQELRVLRKKDGELVEESVLPVGFVPLVDETGKRH
jgi:protein-L-isoaspartate(D-aspartate) O-methyltransferase